MVVVLVFGCVGVFASSKGLLREREDCLGQCSGGVGSGCVLATRHRLDNTVVSIRYTNPFDEI